MSAKYKIKVPVKLKESTKESFSLMHLHWEIESKDHLHRTFRTIACVLTRSRATFWKFKSQNTMYTNITLHYTLTLAYFRIALAKKAFSESCTLECLPVYSKFKDERIKKIEVKAK